MLKLKKITNAEAVTEDLLKDTIPSDAEVAVVKDSAQAKTEIEQVLDEALKHNLMQQRKKNEAHRNWQNILLMGPGGVGKTSVVKQWAAKNNINLLQRRVASLDPTDLGGLPANGGDVAKKLAPIEFDGLERPRSVLFLDEFNRAPKSVRDNFLALISEHVIFDPRVEGQNRVFSNLLFVIAAVNPPDNNYTTDELDLAEMRRFRVLYVTYDNKSVLKYVEEMFDEELEFAEDFEEVKTIEGRRKLAQTLLADRLFTFDSDEDTDAGKAKFNYKYQLLTPSNFATLLDACDGTKEDFLRLYPQFCNRNKFDLIKSILANYNNVDDKATQAIINAKSFLKNLDKVNADVGKKETEEEEVFGSKTLNIDKIRKKGYSV